MHEGLPGRRRLLLLAVLFEGGLGAVACLLGWLLGYPFWQHLRADPADAALGAAASVPMLLLFAACVRWPAGPFAPLKRFADEVIRPLFAQCSLAELALIALLAGLGEELMFRGLLQDVLGRWLGTWPALAVTSLLFGALHPMTLTYAAMAALMGVYLGALVLANGNLLPAVVAHALYDFLALAYLVRRG
jgi:hypothetical protein